MSKLNCPHCGTPGITILRKLFLGPAIPATCNACGKKVGVPYASMLAVIPFFVAVLVSALTEQLAFKVALWVGGIIVMSIVHIRWVPLKPQ